MLKYEFKKHLTLFRCIITALLLLTVIGVVFAENIESITPAGKEILLKQKELFDIYITDPNKYNELYAEHAERLKSYETQQIASMFSSENVIIDFENVYIDQPSYGDIQLFGDVEAVIHSSDEHSRLIGNLLTDTAVRISDVDSEDSYIYNYYIDLLINYDRVKDITWDTAPVCGWNEYFSLELPALICFINILIFSCGVFSSEKNVGTDSVIRLTVKGKRRLTVCKLTFTTLSALTLSLLYTFLPFVPLCFTTGFSSPLVPIQALDGFVYCHFELSALGYLLLFIIIRTLIFSAFAVFTAVINQYSASEIPAYLCGGAMIAFSAVVRSAPFSADSFFAMFNIIDTANVNVMFERLKGINLNGVFLNYTYTVIVTSVIVLALLYAVSFVKNDKSVKASSADGTGAASKKHIDTLFGSEAYKYLIYNGGLLVIVCVLLMKTVISGIYYKPSGTVDETLYRRYMAQFAGEVTDEKTAAVYAEYDYITTIISQHDDIVKSYRDGGITKDEYDEFIGKYNYAVYNKKAMERLVERTDHLISNKDGHENLAFVYEEGIYRLLTQKIDVPLILLAIHFGITVFSSEYDSRFSGILRSTVKGRKSTFKTKLTIGVILSALMYLLFCAAELFVIEFYYDIDYLRYNLLSIPDYGSFPSDISIAAYLTLIKFIGALGSIILFVMLNAAAVLFEAKIKTLCAAAIFVFLPFILVYGVTDIFGAVSIAYTITPQNIFIGSVSLGIMLILSAVLTRRAYVKWTG